MLCDLYIIGEKEYKASVAGDRSATIVQPRQIDNQEDCALWTPIQSKYYTNIQRQCYISIRITIASYYDPAMSLLFSAFYMLHWLRLLLIHSGII